MGHIDHFSIERFRGLRDLKLEDLGQVNLFVGNNNSGKTSVLEALSIFCDPFNERRWVDVASQREVASRMLMPLVDRLSWLFPWSAGRNLDLPSENNEIQISASGSFPTENVSASYEKFTEMVSIPKWRLSEEGEEREEREEETERIKIIVSVLTRKLPNLFNESRETFQSTLTFTERRSFLASGLRTTTLSSQIVTPFSHRTSGLTFQLWSRVVEADLKKETIELLRFFDPDIEDVDIILPSERTQILSIKHKKLGRAPLPTFGDGLRRVFTLATSIPRVRNGLLLVDELETAIHTRALDKTFDWLVKACISNNVQLFATTHSLEALDAILEVSRENADFVAYRLQQNKDKTTATRFDKEMALQLRQELGMELRY